MLNNVRDFGAQGSGTVDDRCAIQAAVDDAVDTGKAGVFFPAGHYRVSRSTAAGARWSIQLREATDLVVAGEGPGSVIQLMDASGPTGDWHVFVLRQSCRRITFTDLVIDGNRQGLKAPDEQSHGMEVEDGTEDLIVDRCILRHCFGDGVRLLGQAGMQAAPVKRVRITNCLFQGNKRSGLGVQRAVGQLIVGHCHFEGTVTDADIDFEPTGKGGPTDIVIQGCVIKHANAAVAVSLSGISGKDPLVNCRFADNLLDGGEIFCTDVARLAIQDNIVVVPHTAQRNRVPVQVQRGGDAVLISGNLIVQEGTRTEAAVSVSEVNGRQVSRALISGNVLLTRGGHGVACLSSDDVAIEGNLIVATGEAKAGVFVRSESSASCGITVRGNDIVVQGPGKWLSGVRFAAAPHGLGQVSATSNSIRGARDGVVFDGSKFLDTPVCALNSVDSSVTSAVVGVGLLPERALIVGGAASGAGSGAAMGAGRQIAGLGDPDGKVSGHVGDSFHRLDGAAGTCFYVKEAGAGTQSGWAAK